MLKTSSLTFANVFEEKQAILLIPQGLKAPILAKQFPLSFYELGVKGLFFTSEHSDKTWLIYAPSLIGTWLLYQSNWRDRPHAKLVIDQNAIIHKYNKIFIKLYLTYEKFRLGSDVASPFITRILQKEGYYPLLKSVTIGEWLTCISATKLYDDRVVII